MYPALAGQPFVTVFPTVHSHQIYVFSITVTMIYYVSNAIALTINERPKPPQL